MQLHPPLPHVAVDVVAEQRRRGHEHHAPDEGGREAGDEPAPRHAPGRSERHEVRGEREPERGQVPGDAGRRWRAPGPRQHAGGEHPAQRREHDGVSRQRVAQDGGNDLRARPERPAHGPADLALAHPRSIVDRHLDDAQPRARGFHLHLDGPAVVAVAHVEPPQRLGRDGAEGAEVRGPRAGQQVHQLHAQPRADDRVPGLGSARTAAEAARADHEVGPAFQDRRDDLGQLARLVAAVSVQEDDDVGVPGRGDSREAGLAVAPQRLRHDRGAGSARDLGRPVARAVVHDDDLVDGGGDRAYDIADRLLLVERWNHDHDARCGHAAPV